MSKLNFPVKKKTPFQKHKENEEEKKKRVDEETARLYEEFVESFQADDDGRQAPKNFVRGGTIMPNTHPEAAPQPPPFAPPQTGFSGRKPVGKYVPSFLPPAFADDANMKGKFGVDDDDDKDESVFAYHSRKPDKDKPRNIDKMLDVLKKEQEAREERQKARREGRGTMFDIPPDPDAGSFDDGDPFTTNLYVGNLASEIDEEILRKEFGRFGAIASVKIMWPRDDDQRRRGRNCGFVAFMRRDDAERAIEKLNGVMLHDNELRIGWGKAVTLPSVPLYPAIGGSGSAAPVKAGASVPPPGVVAAPPWVAPQHSLPSHEDPVPAAAPDVEVKIPEDGRQRFIIDSMAMYVLRDGCAFEQLVMSMEGKNPHYAFLFDLTSPEHAYYRWRLFSLAEGDTLRTWHIEPFYMVRGTERWIPPAMTLAAASAPTAAQKGGLGDVRDRQLSDLERDKFEDMLRNLTVERADVCAAMVFALDNADAAGEVVDILVESLTLAETPVPLKVARLFLVSDILHNSTAPVRNASRYRAKLEAVLPDVFESLQGTYRSVDSRMTQEALRRHVLRVLRVWREAFIFPNDYLNGLQAMFLRNTSQPIEQEGNALAQELQALGDEEVERRCRLSGLSSKGGREAAITRLLALDVYLHGDTRKAMPQPPTPAARTPIVQQVPLLPTPVPVKKEATGIFGDMEEDEDGSDSGGAAPPPPPSASATAMQQVMALSAKWEREAVVKEEVKEAKPAMQSRWTVVDEEEERQQLPQVPISKWLLEEQAAQAAQAAAAAAASHQQQLEAEFAAAMRAAELGGQSDGGDTPPMTDQQYGGVDGQYGMDAAAARQDAAETRGEVAATGGVLSGKDDEERRQRLRKVEVDLLVLRESLEESGMPREQVEAQLAAHRAQLMAEAERDLAGSKDQRDREASTSERDRDKGGSSRSRDRADRDRDKDRERDRERDRDREKDREREKEREREREKERERDREKERSREKDRERDREREKEREREREREREKERERDRKPREGGSRKRSLSASPSRRGRSRSRSPPRRTSKRDRSEERSRSQDRRDKADKSDKKEKDKRDKRHRN